MDNEGKPVYLSYLFFNSIRPRPYISVFFCCHHDELSLVCTEFSILELVEDRGRTYSRFIEPPVCIRGAFHWFLTQLCHGGLLSDWQWREVVANRNTKSMITYFIILEYSFQVEEYRYDTYFEGVGLLNVLCVSRV